MRLLAAALLSCVYVVAVIDVRAQSTARRQARARTTSAPGQTRPTNAPATSPKSAPPSMPASDPLQTPRDGNQTPPASDISTDDADLAIEANVRARELRFETVPNASVEFTGKPRRETVWEAERENLPRPVRPGETYRDIGIRLRIISVFADIDRIVAEALGEVPVEDKREEASPASSSSPTPTPPTLTPTSAPSSTPEAPASPALRTKGREARP